MDIKMKIENIKREVYPQEWGENKAQEKTLSDVNYQQGTFNLAILDPKVPTFHSPTD
jgi:hypothetical protein